MFWLWTAVHTLQLVEILACSSFCKTSFSHTKFPQMFFQAAISFHCVKKKGENVAKSKFLTEVKKLVVFHHFLVVMKEFMKGNKKAEKQLEQLQYFVWLFIQITNTIFFAAC